MAEGIDKKEMNTREALVNTWCRSVSVMHIAHHIAASNCAKWHRWLGASAAILAAIVGTSIFASLSSAEGITPQVIIATGLVSMLSAALTGAVTFLNLDQRARFHLEAAADFQRLRREMEEESVRLGEGKSEESYNEFKDRWHKVLRNSLPLPQSIHDSVKHGFEKDHKE